MVRRYESDTRVQILRNSTNYTGRRKRIGSRVRQFESGKGTSSYYRNRAGIEPQLYISYYKKKHENPTYYEDMHLLNPISHTLDFVGKRFYHMDENDYLYCWTLSEFRNNVALPRRGETITVYSPESVTIDRADNPVQGDPIVFEVTDSFSKKDGKVVRLTVVKK